MAIFYKCLLAKFLIRSPLKAAIVKSCHGAQSKLNPLV